MGSKILLASFVSLMVAIQVSPYPNGPPASTCSDMRPVHGPYVQQSGPSPFSLSASANCFSPGQRILLTLKDPTPPVENLEGLFVQARQRSGPVSSYGVFDTNGQSGIQTFSCFGGTSNSIVHSNNNDKSSVTFGWTAPNSMQSSIVFKYSVVKDFDTFWVGLEYELPLCSGSGGGGGGGGGVTLPPDQPNLTVQPTNNQPPAIQTTQSPACTDLYRGVCTLLNFMHSKICQVEGVKVICCASCQASGRRRGHW